nr:transposase (putative), gypsy type [Tanacetum cinerariifolium]
MGTIDSIKSVLTQSALDALCERFHIPGVVHPELPGRNDKILNSHAGKIGVYSRFSDFSNYRVPLSQFLVDVLDYFQINLSQLSVIAAAMVSYFEILCRVHGFVPTVGNFRSKSLRKDTHLMPVEFNADVCNFLADNPAPFRKLSEPFLWFIGISRYYDLDENCYPTFWDDEDQGGFSLCSSIDPMNVKIGEREAKEGEVSLLELTQERVVPLTGRRASLGRGHVVRLGGIDIVADDEVQAIATDRPKKFRKKKTADGASGSGHPPKKLRGDHGASGNIRASTGGKSLAAIQELFEQSTLNVEVGITAAATVPFVTSFVTPTPEHEGGDYTNSVTGPNMQTQKPAERFIISSYSTCDSKTNAVDNEVTSVVRSSIPDSVILTTVVVDASALVPRFNVGTAHHTCFNAEIRMRLEHKLRGRQRLEERCTLQVNRLKDMDAGIAGLKAQLSLKEAVAAEAIRLCSQIENVEATKAAKDALRLPLLSVKKDKLANQVFVLEVNCFGLRDKVLGYKLFNEMIEEMQDAQIKALSDRLASIDSDLLGMALHVDEEFYPCFLTIIAGWRWILNHGVKLTVVKCLHSLEYMAALGEAERNLNAISAYNPSAEDNYVAAINSLRTIHFPLLAQLEPLKDASMMDVMDLIRLEGPAAEAPGTSQQQPSIEQLTVAHNRVQRLWRDASARRLSLTDVIIPLVEPLSTKSLVGEASSSEVPATNIALSTTFSQVSTIPPAPSTDAPISLKIVCEQEELDTTPEHASAP